MFKTEDLPLLSALSLYWQPNEDVTYATIDHSGAQGSGRARSITDNECDYATVYVPAALQPETVSQGSSKDDCADDYVLMG